MNIHPDQYPITPTEWTTITTAHGPQVAAMMPYPDMDDTRQCHQDPDWVNEDYLRSPKSVAYMKAKCHRCPFEIGCGEYGIAHEVFGIWGGMDAGERKIVRALRGQKLVEPHYSHLYGLGDNYMEEAS